MWLKLYDTSQIPALEVQLPENYLLSCEYRRGNDGRTTISLMRQMVVNDQENLLETRLNPFWKVTDCQIDLYSGEGLIKTMRGCPYSYTITDRGFNGLTIERADILVDGKIVNGMAMTVAGTGTGGNTQVVQNSDGSTSTQKSPYVYKSSYDKGNGRLIAYTDHSLHSELGIFTALDFEIGKINVAGVDLVASDVSLDVYRTSHEQVVFTITGDTKAKVDANVPTTGTNNGAYKLICNAGWNYKVSEYQSTTLEVSNTGTTSTATKITRMVYDIPSAILTIFTSGAFASTRTDGSYQASDFDASKITIGGVHSYAWTNTQFVSSSAGMAKIQILGNCVDFMNNYATANGKVGADNVSYTWDAREGWNTGASTAQNGVLEITGYVDYKAPDAPVGFRAMAFDQSIHLMAEQANKETDLAGYNYYVDGVKHNATPYPDFMYDVTGLINGKSYNFYMTAIDKEGNESVSTEVIAIAPKDTNAPAVPAGLTLMNGETGIHAMWDANQESDVVGYFVYVDGVKYSSEPIKAVMVDLEGIASGEHNYSVTAIDSSGNESPKSAVVKFG